MRDVSFPKAQGAAVGLGCHEGGGEAGAAVVPRSQPKPRTGGWFVHTGCSWETVAVNHEYVIYLCENPEDAYVPLYLCTYAHVYLRSRTHIANYPLQIYVYVLITVEV